MRILKELAVGAETTEAGSVYISYDHESWLKSVKITLVVLNK